MEHPYIFLRYQLRYRCRSLLIVDLSKLGS